ncbi:MAG: RnfH family protein [Gammaproteobacteria bacterium]|nr:RnfH family protein [Gammaproteobacteria bacterium]
MSSGKRCTVVYATRERQFLWEVELGAAARIADALAEARRAAAAAPASGAGVHADAGTGAGAVASDGAIPWDSAPVGIFGELRERSDVYADGDRIELYRPLRRDPRERRRERVQRERRTGRTGRR